MLTRYLCHVGIGEESLDGRPDGERAGLVAAAQHARIPFENLDVFLGRPLTADPDDIAERLLVERRGGFCYQLNGLLLLALGELGIEAWPLGARVRTGSGLGRERGHMALLVPGGSGRGRLVDVGFGGDAVIRDVDLTDADTLVVHAPTGGYVLDPRPAVLADFAEPAHWQSTAPESRFTGSVICSRTRDGIRRTLTARPDPGGVLRYRRVETGARRVERDVAHARVRDVLAADFGIDLPQPPLRVPAGLRSHR